MCWLALIIPFITACVLWVCWQRQTTWWELLIPLIVSVVLIFSCSWLTEYTQTADTEYWTGWVKQANYYEHWNEMVTRTETYTETEGFGKDARTVTKTRIVHEVVDHPPSWEVVDSNGTEVSISRQHFEYLAKKFNSKKFINMHRSYHTIDGDKYEAHWPGTDDLLEVVSTTHTYSNRIIASNNSLKPIKPDEKEKELYGLMDYPKIHSHYVLPSILGYNDPVAERKLSILNAKLGKSKQIRVWILVFKNQPLQAAFSQMNYWENGNKNELVLNIGIDTEENIEWAYVFSWTEKELLKIQTRDAAGEQKKLNLTEVVDKIEPLIREDWQRKSFHDFDYISVEPPWWATFLIYMLTLASSVGLSFWIVGNNYTNDEPKSRYRRFTRR